MSDIEFSIHIDLQTLCILLLLMFISCTLSLCVAFIYRFFTSPNLREKLWHGFTNGDNNPSLEDFQRTTQLFFAFVFGIGLVIYFIICAGYPDIDLNFLMWPLITVFLACVGLHSIITLFRK